MTAAVLEAPDAANGHHRPTYNPIAEQSVLGAMMSSKDAVAAVVETLTADDFYLVANQTIFSMIMKMATGGHGVDPVTLGRALDGEGQLALVGGLEYLHDCLRSFPTVDNVTYYANIVYEDAVLRRVHETGIKITQLSQRALPIGIGANELVDSVQELTYKLSSRAGTSSRARSLADLLQPTLDQIEANGTARSGLGKIPTGFIELDRLLAGGLEPGQSVIVAGRPGMGKTTAGLDFARHAAIKHNIPVAFFSLEMTDTELITRMLSAESRVPLHALRTGQLTDDDWSKLARRMGEISEAPIFVDDFEDLTLMSMRTRARRLVEQFGVRLIIVDYLQLMHSGLKSESRQEEVSQLSRGFKKLAKALGCAIIAICQLNRDVEGQKEKRPSLHHLRESGSLEQDADIVILVHRDDYYDKESPRAGEADFIVAKHRNGPTDTITVAAQLHMSRFVDMAIT